MVAKTLVLVPVTLLVVAALGGGGVRPLLGRAVLSSAEAVAQPVADVLLERLPWPGPRAADERRCVVGPYAAEHPCTLRVTQSPT